MTNLKCSICGGRVECAILTLSPPITQYTCSKCGATKNSTQIETQIINMKPLKPIKKGLIKGGLKNNI